MRERRYPDKETRVYKLLTPRQPPVFSSSAPAWHDPIFGRQDLPDEGGLEMQIHKAIIVVLGHIEEDGMLSMSSLVGREIEEVSSTAFE